MKRAMVTGGAGFIGGHLVRRLLSEGVEVTVLDDLSSGKRETVPPEARFIQGDVLDPAAVAEAMEDAQACFHLAAVASVVRCNEALIASHMVNVTGMLRMVEAITAAGRPIRLVYASSAAVYGASQDLPLAETAATTPLSPYGADKLGCELHARAAWEVCRVTSTGFRFFNVYGPGQDPTSPYSGVISKFADRLLANQPVTIFGDGLQSRDFVYVADVVEGLVRAARSDETGARVLNICTGSEVTILELARVMAEAFNRPPVINHVDGLSGEVRHSRGDATRLEAALGYRPRTTLAEGLGKLRAALEAA
ncbi:NAD-dependent epimerase/dehydratase family protein [Brevundimonas sp. 2R-24]|uniref:NAD-dependent epimerase/dehydratase family protein n=1 Tax=Peiella sedimenti TaxID=3061083 RepID=A0ABT8SKC5_9CAUL|nr:NAD-dependent epimerase/dehydratase family protein [Caulobacteraceae bacterium XZ-24]